MSASPHVSRTQPATGLDATAATIVLSTYNGAAYVAEQIASIQRQTHRAWTLLIRDDGSRDETRAILSALAAADPRLEVLPPDGRNLGAAASFAELLRIAHGRGSRYTFLSDQDDVWAEDKLHAQLAVLREREQALGAEVPLLVHSDLVVADATLAPVYPSFMRYQGMAAGQREPLRHLLVQNVVTGCASAVNRALLDVALPMPRVAMHDWWLGECAAAFGELVYLPRALVLYRQHGRNVVGAQNARRRLLALLRAPRSWWSRSGSAFVASVRQAAELERRLGDARGTVDGNGNARQIVGAYCAAYRETRSTIGRLAGVARSGVAPQTVRRRMLLYARVAAYRRLEQAAGSAD